MTDEVAAAPPTKKPIDTDWEEPPRSIARLDVPVLSVEGFEGPLDWLLDMARARKIDLARLPIAALIQSFAGALESALARPDGRAPDLQLWGDWLVMAATLAQLRSRLLLPADTPEAKAAVSEAEAWRRQLVGRAQMAAAADWLERQPQLGREVFGRGRSERREHSRAADITDLLRACLPLLKVPDELVEKYQPRPAPFWRVADALERIETMLRETTTGTVLTDYLPVVSAALPDRLVRCRAAVASTLVTGLELARGGGLLLTQEEDWGEVFVAVANREQAADNADRAM